MIETACSQVATSHGQRPICT